MGGGGSRHFLDFFSQSPLINLVPHDVDVPFVKAERNMFKIPLTTHFAFFFGIFASEYVFYENLKFGRFISSPEHRNRGKMHLQSNMQVILYRMAVIWAGHIEEYIEPGSIYLCCRWYLPTCVPGTASAESIVKRIATLF